MEEGSWKGGKRQGGGRADCGGRLILGWTNMQVDIWLQHGEMDALFRLLDRDESSEIEFTVTCGGGRGGLLSAGAATREWDE